MKIAMLGAGAFGTALGGILADNGHEVSYYDPKLRQEKLPDVLEGAKYMVLCVPSEVVPHLLSDLPKEIPLIITTKGILSDKVFVKFQDFMVLSGPGFADDIKSRKETFFTVTDQRVIELFRADFVKFDITDDCKGVLMCGALKNVYAILAGFLNLQRDSVKWNEFIDQVLGEMREILKLNGANPATVDLACGIGDLKLTCGLPSRNYEYGQILRKNPDVKPEKTAEGLTALQKIKQKEIIIPDDSKNLRDLMDMIC